MNSVRAGRRAVAAAGSSPGPGLGIKVAPGPIGALGGRPLSSMGEGSGHPHLNPVEFPFLSSVNFCAINIFPFPFRIQNRVHKGWS